MTRSSSSPNAGQTIVSPLKPYEGGFGTTTQAASRAAIDGIPLTAINQPNGIAGLDSSGKILDAVVPVDSTSVVSVQGASSVVKGGSAIYTITNYNNFQTYTVTAISGSVSVSGSLITYSAPAVAGNGGFVINGRTVNIPIDDYKPIKPTLSVVDAYGGPTNAVLQCTGSAFTVNGGTATHLNTDWQVATDSTFNNIASSSMADATNKTTWTSGALNLSNTYYVRCRYRDSTNAVSDWSDATTITTKSSYVISIEEAKLVASDKAAGDYFGYAVACDNNATRVIVGAAYASPGGTSTAGAAYVFLRTGTTWTQEAKLTASDKALNDYFGGAVICDSTATRVIVGAFNSSPNSISNAGSAYVFVRSGTTWTQEAKLVAADKASGDYFGMAVSTDSTATRAIIGAPYSDPSGVGNAGAAYVFLRTGTSWAQEAKLTASDAAANDLFATSISSDSSATRIIIGAYEADVSSLADAGAAYVFLRTGTSWTQEAKLSASDKAASDFLGYSVAIDSTGTRAVAGAYNSDPGGTSNAGAAYVFIRSGTVWTQEAKLVAADKAANDQFGFSVYIDSSGSRIVSGSRLSDPSALNNAGSIYIFGRSGSSWGQESKITASDKAANDQFGQAVAIDGTADRVIVGALTESPGGTTNAGAVYIYR